MIESNTPTILTPFTPVVKARYDPADDDTPAEAVVDAVATATDRDPLELPRLYDAINPDIINNLLDGTSRSHRNGFVFGFEFLEWNILIRGDGTIFVFDPDGAVEETPRMGSDEIT